MFSFKRLFVLLITAVFAVSALPAQNSGEMSIEQSYMQRAIEVMIIRESARASSREQKLISLQYIGEAIDRGNDDDEIRQTLVYLSREGRRSVARENGRVMNNFPDVRRQAARYLGLVGTEEARDALLEICQFENEPMVLQEAIKSLGDIGLNDDNETIANIAFVMRRFDNLNPDNLMAIATIDAFDKIARKNGGINSPEAIQILIRIAEGHYIKPVQERARQLIAELRSYGR
jgi:HEAT repeat protein